MKQSRLIIAVLVIGIICFGMPALAQSKPINYETYLVDGFDTPDEEWTWIAVGSKFVTDGFPIVQFFDGMPNALKVMQNDPEGQYKILGIQFKFDRKGDNWVDIVPTLKGDGDTIEPYEIPFKGKIARLDMWVWGANYNYDLEVLIRDCNGIVHTLKMGSLRHEGWKNLFVNIPTNIPQASPYLNGIQQLSFVAFRIRTQPTERVDSFHVFFDQFKALTDIFSESYDGFELVTTKFNDDSNIEE